jgi:hypothetical protein
MKRIVSLLESDGGRSSAPAFTTNEALRIRHRRGLISMKTYEKPMNTRRKAEENPVPYS